MELPGHGVTLREWKLTDAESLQKHADNPNISSCLMDRFPSPYTMDSAINFINAMLQQMPPVNFAISVDGQAVGVIGLEIRTDVYRNAPLLGFWIGEEYWGRGIMPQAVRLITNYAFEDLNMMRVQAGVLGSNPRSMRTLEKAGFVLEGILKNNLVKNDIILDEHIYGLVKA